MIDYRYDADRATVFEAIYGFQPSSRELTVENAIRLEEIAQEEKKRPYSAGWIARHDPEEYNRIMETLHF